MGCSFRDIDKLGVGELYLVSGVYGDRFLAFVWEAYYGRSGDLLGEFLVLRPG